MFNSQINDEEDNFRLTKNETKICHIWFSEKFLYWSHTQNDFSSFLGLFKSLFSEVMDKEFGYSSKILLNFSKALLFNSYNLLMYLSLYEYKLWLTQLLNSSHTFLIWVGMLHVMIYKNSNSQFSYFAKFSHYCPYLAYATVKKKKRKENCRAFSIHIWKIYLPLSFCHVLNYPEALIIHSSSPTLKPTHSSRPYL